MIEASEIWLPPSDSEASEILLPPSDSEASEILLPPSGSEDSGTLFPKLNLLSDQHDAASCSTVSRPAQERSMMERQNSSHRKCSCGLYNCV